MLIPMVFTKLSLVLKQWATFFDPFWFFTTIFIDEPLNIPNTLAFCDYSWLGNVFFTEVDGLFLLLNIAGLKAHAGKLVKPDKCVTVGAVFNRDFRHLSRLKTAPTDAFHLLPIWDKGITDVTQWAVEARRNWLVGLWCKVCSWARNG